MLSFEYRLLGVLPSIQAGLSGLFGTLPSMCAEGCCERAVLPVMSVAPDDVGDGRNIIGDAA